MTDSSERQSSPCAESGTFARLIEANDPLGLFTPSDSDTLGRVIEVSLIPLTLQPLEALPCSNACPSPGRLPCARCKLVSYCSQKCEKQHRKVHKQNCSETPSGSSALPGDSIHDDTHFYSNSSSPHEETALMAASLSRNMPAVDIINLKNNEKDKMRGFSLAFAASGDLRNVVRTVNALGSDFTGHLHILLNDTSDVVVSRNIVLLLILGAMPNEAVAADIALHFWYSVFLPEEHRLRVLSLLLLVLGQRKDKTEPLSIPLGRCARLTCLVPREITDCLLYAAGPTRSTCQARAEYERVGATPVRRDAKKRVLAGLKPCHQLALMAFWRSGVVLPFSIAGDHHTVPNPSLFSPTGGTWLQNRVENPLASWDPNEIIKAGQAHGAQPEDIYGCLYFFLSDQLRTFAKRLHHFDITFQVFNTTAQTLAQDIHCGVYSQYGLTSGIRFDRIDLGHALEDLECVRDVLTAWTPLLVGGDTATMICMFTKWTHAQKDGSVAGADEAIVAPIVAKLIKLGRLPTGMTLANATATETASLDATYSNAKAFSTFLKAISLNEILHETTKTMKPVKRRLRHRIVPQRVRMPIDAKTIDLPHMPDDETWYRYVKLAQISFTTRYAELARAAV